MTRLGDDVVHSFTTGRKSGVGTTAVPLVTAVRPLTRGLQLRAAATNTGTVYVGASSAVTADAADATDGFPLAAGEGLLVKVDDASKVYLIASAASQKVFYLAV